MVDMPRPSMGRIVWYRSRTGDYACAALITATKDGPVCQRNIDEGYMVGFTSATHVHLDVRSPGIPGKQRTSDFTEGFKDQTGIKMPASSGGYAEFDVPFWHPGKDKWEFDEQPPRTWTWPPRI